VRAPGTQESRSGIRQTVCVAAAQPQLELLAPPVGDGPASASPEEAAAILVALELFISDTAPGPGPGGAASASEWLRIARLEAVARAPSAALSWSTTSPLN
jgi:hypothetical protein